MIFASSISDFLDCVAADEVPFDGTVDWRLHLVLFLKFFFWKNSPWYLIGQVEVFD